VQQYYYHVSGLLLGLLGLGVHIVSSRLFKYNFDQSKRSFNRSVNALILVELVELVDLLRKRYTVLQLIVRSFYLFYCSELMLAPLQYQSAAKPNGNWRSISVALLQS
jgi:hypothetical protein